MMAPRLLLLLPELAVVGGDEAGAGEAAAGLGEGLAVVVP